MTDVLVTNEPPRLARWRWTVTTGFGLGGITISAWGPRLPAIKASLGIDTGTIGLLLAGVTAGALLGLLAAAPLLHRLGSRRALGTALLLIVASMTVMGLGLIVGSVPVLAVAFVAVGAGIGALDVLLNVNGAAVETAAGRTLMPMMHAAWSIGVAAGAGIGAVCAALGISPAAQMIGEAVVVAVMAVVAAPGIPQRIHEEEVPAARPRQRPGARLRGWLDVRLLLIGVVMLGVELGEGSAGNWLTLAVRNYRGQTAAAAALFFAAFAIGEATTRIFGGPLVDRLGRVRTIQITTALGVIGVVAFIEGPDKWVVLAGVILWSIGVSMGFPLGTSAAAASGPDPASRVSVVSSIGYFANLAGPPAIGLLAQHVGLLGSLWIIAGLFIAAFACAGALAPVTADGALRVQESSPAA